MKKFKLISCKVFEAEINLLLTTINAELEITWIDLGEHARPQKLRQKIQNEIDIARGVDAVLLAYGLCGTAIDNLATGEIPVVAIRNHDCAGILLGSRLRFQEIFSIMPSTPFSSCGMEKYGDYYFKNDELIYGDSYQMLIEEYGEEDAAYIASSMNPALDGVLRPIYFIESPGIDCTAAKASVQMQCTAEGREFYEVTGSLRLLKMLINGEWPEAEFLLVQPGRRIRQCGDWDEIIRAVYN